MLLNIIIKPFDLLKTIPFSRTKTLVNIEHKLPIFEILILNTK